MSMNINELTSDMRHVTVEGVVEKITEPRTVNLRAGGSAQVADAIISLWDEQIKMIKEGDKILIENGYTQAFRGENSLNIGRYGKLTVLDE
jgi:replication factor A1